MSYRLGVDVGGTFTDFVLMDGEGNFIEAKLPSSPRDSGEVMGKGLHELAEKLRIPLAEMLGRTNLLIHGTTVAINALLQHRGAKTGLICTAGFRDTLEIRLGYRDVRYDFRYPPPPILVPRHLRLPVRERVDKEGQVYEPLAEADVYRAIREFKTEKIEAVAVCLLWSFYNPAHERRVGEVLRQEMPGVYIALSSEIAPQIREYDRTSTTVLNAYLGPGLSRYISETERYLRDLGFRGEIRYIQSNGGIAAGDIISIHAVLALNSGPAAAPAAGVFFGRRLGHDNLITIDMGGTSFDACLIENGVPDVRATTDVNRYRLAVPMVNINAIGAGGGSIAWIDAGIVRVGPRSAEAYPGPACYMRGGVEPTVTDADVVLGYLNPGALLGGTFKIDASLAHGAVNRRIAKPLGLSVTQAAVSIFEIVNQNMANAMSEISLERGYDPRDFVMVAAGGQGAVHAGELANELNIPTIVIPKTASTFCAFGALAADLRHDYKRSYAYRIADADLEALEGVFQKMEAVGYRELTLEGVMRERVQVVRKLHMRYVGQIYEVEVDVSKLSLSSSGAHELTERLHRRHEEEYSYSHEGGVGEIINAAVTMSARLPEIRIPTHASISRDASHAQKEERRVFFREYGDYHPVPVYDGSVLHPGNHILGPAVVEEPHTTVVVFPEWELELTPISAYLMRRVS